MHVAGVHQFYFDHFLPTDDSWPPDGFNIASGDVDVRVACRTADEPLYPEDIDRTLSTLQFTLTPVSRPGGKHTTTVADAIVDRMAVTALHRAVDPDSDGLPSASTLAELTEAAIEAADIVLAHLRVLTAGRFLTGVRREYRLEDDEVYVMIPHTISWHGGDNPAALPPLRVYPGGVNGQASSGAVRVPERGAVSFTEFVTSLERSGREPSLSLTLLAHAEERIVEMSLREACVLMATACEVASDEYIDAIPDGRSAAATILGDRATSFAEKRWHHITQLLDHRSLLVEDEPAHVDLTSLYRARNNIAHRGRLAIRDERGTRTVDQRMARAFLHAARRAISWLDDLPTQRSARRGPAT